ncbi:hypothetical protein MACH26_34130 [Planctobacterium marinum]|uniref:DUF4347 domain-containing protein n=2 Tax=Planctobacterium marinum TaxID=1631968 RepID=A0AA48KT69_9ALTE|nr:hypothetical protein MACH26_34130 [Planctobacterium marinum]
MQAYRTELNDRDLTISSGTHFGPDLKRADHEPTLYQQQSVTELVVFDAGVQDRQVLKEGLKPGVKWVELQAGRSGIEQLTEILVQYQNLESVHIVSHGESGALQLGNSRVDASVIQDNEQLVNALNDATIKGADIQFYGCDLATGEKGAEFLDILSAETHLDIAASDDLTGTPKLNGDWDLEIVRGEIESSVPFSEKALLDFSEVLVASDGIKTFSGFTDNGNDLTSTDFVVTGECASTAFTNWQVASGEAYVSDSSGTATEACTITVAADGTNTGSFQLTGISFREYLAGFDFYSVKVVGTRADGGHRRLG